MMLRKMARLRSRRICDGDRKYFLFGGVACVGFPDSGFDVATDGDSRDRGVDECDESRGGREDGFGGVWDWTGGNYAISLSSIEEFVSGAKMEMQVGGVFKVPRKAPAMLKDAMASVALVAVYQANDGAIELAALRTDEEDSQKERELDAAVQKVILQGQLYKVRKDWEALKEMTEKIIKGGAKIKEIVELNELAKKELQKEKDKEINTTKKGEEK